MLLYILDILWPGSSDKPKNSWEYPEGRQKEMFNSMSLCSIVQTLTALMYNMHTMYIVYLSKYNHEPVI